MSAATSGVLVRLPSGRVIGAEVNDRGNLVPHEWNCDRGRCDLVAEAKRQRVRDAAPDLLAVLVAVFDEVKDYPAKKPTSVDSFLPAEFREQIRAAIAKATSS